MGKPARDAAGRLLVVWRCSGAIAAWDGLLVVKRQFAHKFVTSTLRQSPWRVVDRFQPFVSDGHTVTRWGILLPCIINNEQLRNFASLPAEQPAAGWLSVVRRCSGAVGSMDYFCRYISVTVRLRRAQRSMKCDPMSVGRISPCQTDVIPHAL